MDIMEEHVYNQETFRNRIESSTLYEAIRPTTFDEYVGQEHLLNKDNGSIYAFIKLGYLPSMIFLGPPGVGKTTLASIISYECSLPFIELSATTLTTLELKQIVSSHEKQIVVFIDEIHRLTKVQQDWLLPYVENGEMILIGATTSHPSKRIRHAILSRCHVFHLHTLGADELKIILKKAIAYQNLKRKHLLQLPPVIYEDASIDLILEKSHGDSRIAINLVELISKYFEDTQRKSSTLTKDHLEKILSNLTYISNGEGVKNKGIFKSFIDVLRQGCGPSYRGDLFYDQPLEFFYDEFKTTRVDNKYIEQIQVSDDSDVEDGDIYSDHDSEKEPSIDDMRYGDFQLVSAIYYMNLLLLKGESPKTILRHLLLFSVKYTECDNTTFGKLLASSKGIDNRSDGNSVNILSNCIEWLMYKRRTRLGMELSCHLEELKDYFTDHKSISHVSQTDSNIDVLEVSYDENEIINIETYPQFIQSQESQIKGFEVTYDDNLCDSDFICY